MYYLTLTRDERRAIDWIGHRYFHGNDFYNLLEEAFEETKPEDFPAEFDDLWEGLENLIFTIPEPIAWQIREGFALENYEFACFCDSLKLKLLEFCEKVV